MSKSTNPSAPTEANKLTAVMARGHDQMRPLLETEKLANVGLHKALDNKDKEIASLKDTVSKLDTNNSGLRAKFDVLRRQYDNLKGEHEELNIAFKERGNTIETATRQAGEAASVIEALRNENKALNGQFNASIKTAHEHIGAHQDALNKIARLEHALKYVTVQAWMLGIGCAVVITAGLYYSLN